MFDDAQASKHPDDVVIVCALRTPITRARKGGLKDTTADDLVATVLHAAMKETKNINPTDIGDVVVGSVLGDSSQRANECRIGMFLAGFPVKVPVRTVNRQCSSGLQACADVASAIKAGYYEVGIAAGVETMSKNPMKWDGGFNPKAASVTNAQNCLIPMGVTSENVAAKWNISREEQDAFAAESHRRAAEARRNGKFKSQIVPVVTKIIDKETKMEKEVIVTEDDGIREGVTVENLAKLKPVFKKGGSTTAGNASQVSDGAGVVILCKRSYATKHGLKVMAKWKSFSAVGCPPEIMGIGPAVAIPDACERAGVKVSDINLFELNEAFASQASYCVNHLKLNKDIVNVNGGAIALGHPLGATGARCMATLLHEMHSRDPSCKLGVVSMCIGSGMGAAAVVERE